jgi:hypothetical protein
MPLQPAGMTLPAAIAPDFWLRQSFSAHTGRSGGAVRRSLCDTQRIPGRMAIGRKPCRRGCRAVANSGQFMVICIGCIGAPVRLIG